MEQETITKVEIIGAVTLVLVLGIVFLGGPSITGYQLLDFVVEDLDISVSQSQEYTLSGSGEDFLLTSLKVAGEVIGDGKVEVYLDNGNGQRLLIYANNRPYANSMELITGMAISPEELESGEEPKQGSHLLIDPLRFTDEKPKPLKEEEQTDSGAFANECVDSCFIRMLMSEETVYALVFLVEEGTTLRVDKIFYTVDI